MVTGAIILLIGIVIGYASGRKLSHKIEKLIKESFTKRAKIIDTSPDVDLGNKNE